MGKVMYCERCGRVYYIILSKKCDFCKTKMKLLPEELKYKYHIFVEDWSQTSDEEEIQRKENFVFGELLNNPIFSLEDYKNQVQNQIQLNKELDEYHKKQLEEQRLKILNKNLKTIQKEQDKQNCIPKCPICGSTNVNKISVTSRAVKTAAFGVYGAVDDAGKTYKCGNCGSKF